MLEENKLYVKKCRSCGLNFRTDKQKAKICPECRKFKKHESILAERAKRKKPVTLKGHVPGMPSLTINEMCRIIRIYNKKNKTTYSYGQFVYLVGEGRIKI